jgi:hypothetical protein
MEHETDIFSTNKIINNLLESLNYYKNSENDIKQRILESNNTTEIISFIDEFTILISQSIQAINTLHVENLNLKELLYKTKDSHEFQNKYHQVEEKDNHSNGIYLIYDYSQYKNNDNYNKNDEVHINNNEEEKTKENCLEEVKGKTSLRYKIITEAKNDKLEKLNLDLIKITNDILRKIKGTERYQKFFGEKYSNGSYKDFLNNLIDYKFEIKILKEINLDVEKLEMSTISEESFSNFIKDKTSPKILRNKSQNSHRSEKENCEKNFEMNLRKYHTASMKIKKPFNRFIKSN